MDIRFAGVYNLGKTNDLASTAGLYVGSVCLLSNTWCLYSGVYAGIGFNHEQAGGGVGSYRAPDDGSPDHAPCSDPIGLGIQG